MNLPDGNNSVPEKFSFLSHGGEMGALMRAKNWEENVLGNPDNWPQSLRTTLSIILNSRFPMFLFWGPQLICFYNDAYRPSLGQNGKHPAILGMKGKDAWPEIWPVIQPLIDQVLGGGEATWHENELIPIYRNGKIENVYWTFSYSPVDDESGKPAGVFVTCNETTENINSTKKLEESKEQLEFAIEAAEMGTFDYDPVTNKFSANDRLKQWFGLQPDEEIELQHAMNAIAQNDKLRVAAAIQQSLDYTSGGRYNIEYTIIHPATGKKMIVHAKGKTSFDQNKIAFRLNGTLTDETANITALKEIRESEQRVRVMFDSAPFPIGVYTGKEMKIILANQNIIDVWGKGNDVIGKSYLEILPELENQEIFQQLEAVYNSGIPFHVSNRQVDIVIDGKLQSYYFSYNFTPLFDTEGKVYGVMNTAADVTDITVANKKVEESEKLYRNTEEKLRIAIDATELGTWEVDLTTRKILYNQRYAKILGHNITDALDYDELLNQVHPDDIIIIEKAFRKAIRDSHYNYVARFVRKDGNTVWIKTQGRVFFDEKKNPVRLIGTIQDVTEAKEYQKELEEREEKFRLLADSLPQFIWTGDKMGNLNYFNEAVYTYSGLTPAEIASDGWLQIVHPDEKEENIQVWLESVRTGKDFVFEHRFRRSDGEYRWQLSRAIPQRDASGNIQMWVGSSTDIQELKKQEEEKDFFISIASHELKTPITSIKAYIQLLLLNYDKDKDAFLAKSLKNVDRQILKLTTLISDMLDLSKIKSGSFYLHKEDFNLNHLIEEVIDEIMHITPSYNITFSKGPEALLNGDRERIGQVVTNFLTNAIKYSPKVMEIKVTSVSEGNKIIVSIEDSGIGINKNDQEKIFDRFYRVEGKNEKTFPGFGIGLYICQEIIRRHNGKIGVISEPGKGSLFYFSLPL